MAVETGAETGSSRLPGTSTMGDALQSLVAAAFAVKVNQLQASTRGEARAAFARQAGIYLARTRLGLEYAAAGQMFGRDRTTAAYACRRIEERREDPAIDGLIECLEQAIDVHPAFHLGEVQKCR